MSRNERVRDRYPVFDAYGARHEFLDPDESVAATTEGRIRSVWPFVVGRVLAFQKTLTARGRANYDPEDVLVDVWVKLAERDHLWSPTKGKYITFAAVIVAHELGAIRDRARTVHAPRNSGCRLAQYLREEEAGVISDQRRRTAADIRRTGAGMAEVAPGSPAERCAGCDPAEEVARSESDALDLAALKRGIASLTPVEALVVGRTSGLWGRPCSPAWDVAWETGRTQEEIVSAQKSATIKLRDHISASRAPVAAAG